MTAGAYPLRRQRNLILGTLALLSAAGWGVVLWQARDMGSSSMGLTMGMSAALFLAIWVAMMAAMMFPSIAPMVLMFARVQAGKRRQGHAAVPTWLFTGTYLAVWSAAGIIAFLGALGGERIGGQSGWLMDHGTRLGGLVLIAAGLYQVSPLKRVCLAKCRSPLAFVMTSWRDGTGGAVRMGLTHSLYCLGCCWFLFVILFPLGMMNIAALALVTLLIFAEKSLPHGDRIAWAAAASLVAYGVAVLLFPTILPFQPSQPMMNM